MLPSGRLTVGGFITFDGQSTDGVLTAGVLEVRGDFFVGGSTGPNFAASGTHKVVFDGTGPQLLQFCCAAGARHFQDVEFANPAGVNINREAQANGNVTITSGDITGPGITFVLAGDLNDAVGDRWQVANTTFTGSPNLPASLRTNATFTGNAVMKGAVTLTGNVTLTGTLDL